MNLVLKGVMVCFILFLLLATLRLSAIAQVASHLPLPWDFPIFSSNSEHSEQILSRFKGLRSGDILVDDFEYWDSLGWIDHSFPYSYG